MQAWWAIRQQPNLAQAKFVQDLRARAVIAYPLHFFLGRENALFIWIAIVFQQLIYQSQAFHFLLQIQHDATARLRNQLKSLLQLFAVIVAPAALANLTAAERRRIMDVLQRATVDGGVHLVQALLGREGDSLAELRLAYDGWTVEIDHNAARPNSFLATKSAH